MEYSDGKVVADEETRKRIIEIGIRRVARVSGVNRETVALVAGRQPVKASTFAKVINSLKQAEACSEREH